MKINKFKKIGKNKYKIFFDNTDIVLYEDIILKYDLLLKKDIDLELLDKITNENLYYEAYYLSLNYIEIKMRCKKEIIAYLKRKDYEDKYIDFAVEKLEKLNLLNSTMYIKAYINDKINLTLDGPYKIKRNLLELDFSEEDIDNYLNTIEDDVWVLKLKKIIEKKKTLMKSKSYNMFISKLKNDLYNMGYPNELICDELSKIEYKSDALTKDYAKAQKKYKTNKNKIISFLLRKGYSYDNIHEVINDK